MLIVVDHIKLRLEDAGRTLMMLPMPKGAVPGEYGSNWPDVMQRAIEIFAAQLAGETETSQEAEERRRKEAEERNFVRLRPSSAQIQRMDEAMDWLWHVTDDRRRRIVAARSLIHPLSGRHVASFAKLGRLYGLHKNTMRQWFDRGVTEIAVALTDPAQKKYVHHGQNVLPKLPR